AAQVLAHFDASGIVRPPPPAHVTAVTGPGSAIVSWTGSTTSGAAPTTGYLVTPIKDGHEQTPIEVAPALTSVRLSDLDSDPPYTFKVTALADHPSLPATSN